MIKIKWRHKQFSEKMNACLATHSYQIDCHAQHCAIMQAVCKAVINQ